MYYVRQITFLSSPTIMIFILASIIIYMLHAQFRLDEKAGQDGKTICVLILRIYFITEYQSLLTAFIKITS